MQPKASVPLLRAALCCRGCPYVCICCAIIYVQAEAKALLYCKSKSTVIPRGIMTWLRLQEVGCYIYHTHIGEAIRGDHP